MKSIKLNILVVMFFIIIVALSSCINDSVNNGNLGNVSTGISSDEFIKIRDFSFE